MSDKPYLLTDEEIVTFIIHGYHIVEADFPDGFNEAVYEELEQINENPGDGILDRVPKLYQVYESSRCAHQLVG